MTSERSVEIPWLESRLGKPSNILDIGSWGISYLAALKNTGASVVLCDTQPLGQVGDAEVYQGSATTLPLEWAGRFDLVTCVSVLDHIDVADAYGNPCVNGSLDQVMGEFYRVTAPGGRCLTTLPFGRDHITRHGSGFAHIFGWDQAMALFPASRWQPITVQAWRLSGPTYEPVQALSQCSDAEYLGHRAEAVIAMEMKRKDVLNLGCGNYPMDNAINLDRTKWAAHVDVAHDLNKTPWPVPDKSMRQIIAHDVLEHLDNFIAFFDECHRILIPGGQIEVRVPRWDSPNVHIDPTHKRGYHIASFDYLDPTTGWGSQYGMYTPFKWRKVSVQDGGNLLALLETI